MKTSKILKLLTVLAVLVGTSSFAVITGSKHDLSVDSNASIKVDTGGTTEICVFCHTPHGATSSYTGAPIWNKVTGIATTFTMYGTTLAAGTAKRNWAPAAALPKLVSRCRRPGSISVCT